MPLIETLLGWRERDNEFRGEELASIQRARKLYGVTAVSKEPSDLAPVEDDAQRLWRCAKFYPVLSLLQRFFAFLVIAAGAAPILRTSPPSRSWIRSPMRRELAPECAKCSPCRSFSRTATMAILQRFGF